MSTVRSVTAGRRMPVGSAETVPAPEGAPAQSALEVRFGGAFL
jgi:hypothetical protein